ncbi:MAG: ATP-binding cassette domain-containing protein, partial [Coriobacteriia bacterium]|nr:ATP-binding cassette domain-containing protein [Coriobacteriia bacterium]
MALELTGVSYTYAEGTPFAQTALADVDLWLEPGNALTLVAGPTGSGKSTLLRIAAGLMAPQTGSVKLEGETVTGVVAGMKGGVGLVFQSPETQLFAETILADVAFGPRNQGASAEEAEEAARGAMLAVGLDPVQFGTRSPFTLSGGEARRAALAGVLALRPRYLLLDEPLAGLDAAGRATVVAAIERMRQDTGIAIVSHDIEDVLALADRALVLCEGRSAFFGAAGDLVQDPGVLEEAG